MLKHKIKNTLTIERTGRLRAKKIALIALVTKHKSALLQSLCALTVGVTENGRIGGCKVKQASPVAVQKSRASRGILDSYKGQHCIIQSVNMAGSQFIHHS